MLYKHCYRCGGRGKKFDHVATTCTRCDFIMYENPKPSNAIILENGKGEILLVKRARAPRKGWYDLPGGFVDPGENMETSMRRELKEELDISVSKIFYFDSCIDSYTYQRVTHQVITSVYAGKLGKTKPTPQDDVASVAFFAKNKLPLARMAFPGLCCVLREYIG